MIASRFKSVLLTCLLLAVGSFSMLMMPPALAAQSTEDATEEVHSTVDDETAGETHEADSQEGHGDGGHGEAPPLWLTLPFVALLVMTHQGRSCPVRRRNPRIFWAWISNSDRSLTGPIG